MAEGANWVAFFEEYKPWDSDTCDTRDTPQKPSHFYARQSLTERDSPSLDRDTSSEEAPERDTSFDVVSMPYGDMSHVSHVSRVTGISPGFGPVQIRGYDLFEERAAMLEHAAAMDRRTAERGAVAELLMGWMDDPPLLFGDVPPRALLQFFEDARAFVKLGWLQTAEALGWVLSDIAGADADRPYARLDRAGLLWALHGDRLMAISNEAATIQKKSGSRLMFSRPSTRQ